MNDLRTAAQQALEFIEVTNKSSSFRLVPDSNLNKTITTLRAALAQQDEPRNLSDRAVQKRLAAQWGYVPAQIESRPLEPDIAKIVSDNLGKLYVEDPVEPVQEPVAKCVDDICSEHLGRVEAFDHLPRGTLLYAILPQRQPLTEEEIERICEEYLSPRQLARAVERAHGIKERNNGKA